MFTDACQGTYGTDLMDKTKRPAGHSAGAETPRPCASAHQQTREPRWPTYLCMCSARTESLDGHTSVQPAAPEYRRTPDPALCVDSWTTRSRDAMRRCNLSMRALSLLCAKTNTDTTPTKSFAKCPSGRQPTKTVAADWPKGKVRAAEIRYARFIRYPRSRQTYSKAGKTRGCTAHR